MLPRDPNYIWQQLAEDRLTATFIADGHHLPAATFRAMIRAKGDHRSILISDSIGIAGSPPGHYTGTGGEPVELMPDGRLCLSGTPLLAGAVRSLSEGLGWAATQGALGLARGGRTGRRVTRLVCSASSGEESFELAMWPTLWCSTLTKAPAPCPLVRRSWQDRKYGRYEIRGIDSARRRFAARSAEAGGPTIEVANLSAQLPKE